MSFTGARKQILDFGQSQASCSPLIPVFVLSQANHLLAPSSCLMDENESGIDLLIWLLARKRISVFPKMSNYSFKLLFQSFNSKIQQNTKKSSKILKSAQNVIIGIDIILPRPIWVRFNLSHHYVRYHVLHNIWLT